MIAVKGDSTLVGYQTHWMMKKTRETQVYVSELPGKKILLGYWNTLTFNDYDVNKSNWQIINLISKKQ